MKQKAGEMSLNFSFLDKPFWHVFVNIFENKDKVKLPV
jgi:hypothetical protein